MPIRVDPAKIARENVDSLGGTASDLLLALAKHPQGAFEPTELSESQDISIERVRELLGQMNRQNLVHQHPNETHYYINLAHRDMIYHRLRRRKLGRPERAEDPTGQAGWEDYPDLGKSPLPERE
jgi:hypothetical protein